MLKTVTPWVIFVLSAVALVYMVHIGLGSAAIFLALAFGAAYLFFPTLIWLEKRKISRGLSVIFLFSVLTGGSVLILLLIVPRLFRELESLIRLLPGILQTLIFHAKSFIETYQLPLPTDMTELTTFIESHLTQILENLAQPLLKSATQLVTGFLGVLLWILNLILIPVFFFFLTLDFEEISKSLKDLVPKRLRPKATYYAQGLDQILSGFIRGQLMVCLVLAILYSVILSLLDVQFGFLIGTIAGLCSFIPYFGASIFVGTSILVSFWMGKPFSHFVWLLSLYGVIQAVESFILTPKLVGNRVGLQSLGAILSLIVGANLFGFWGILIAVPLGGFVKFIALDLLSLYKDSSFYRHS